MRRVFLSLALASCGVEIGEPPDVDQSNGKGDDDDDGGGNNTPLTATRFLARIGVQYCDESFRCKATYPEGTDVFEDDFGASRQACYDGVDAYYRPALVEQSIAAGRVIFSAIAADACLDGVSYPQQCSMFWDTAPVFPNACDVTLLGTVPDGAACVSIFDCANITSFCDDMTKRCTASP